MAATLLLALGCASGGAPNEQTDPLPGESSIGLGRGETLPTFTPAESATENWSRAEKAFEDEDYLLAQRYYVYIRRKFPYSRYAVLSDLRIADCQFERERYLEAIDSYQSFVRLHPTHPEVPVALFKTGLAHEKQIPDDWFFLPPAHEKDQSAVEDTAKAFASYLERFPEHENADDARERLGRARRKLMAHERYVADFYERLGKLRGYVGRLERIKTRFRDVGLDPDLLLEIVRAYVRLGEAEKARAAVEELAETFPEAPALTEAREAVAALDSSPAPSDAPPE